MCLLHIAFKLNLKARGILMKNTLNKSGDFSVNEALGEMTRNPSTGILS
jgi:hypothetical protein